MKLTLEQSKNIKGIAILMMVYFHLFMPHSDVNACSYSLYIGDVPLILFLSRAASPVPFYLFMSGYGLYYIWQSGQNLKPLRRCLNLYRIYWVSLIVMVSIASFVRPDTYPGTIVDVIENVTGWSTSYNSEAWFLFPYILLVLSATWLFPLVSRYSGLLVAGVTYGLFLIAIGIISLLSKSGNDWLFYTKWYYYPFLYIECLCPFIFGCIMCKNSGNSKSYKFLCILGKKWKVLLLLILLIISRCMITTTAYGPIFALMAIFLLSQVQWTMWQNRILGFFGEHSTTIWLTHSYFCYYLFHDFIYGFRYPIIVFLVTLLCSLCASFVIKNLCILFRV